MRNGRLGLRRAACFYVMLAKCVVLKRGGNYKRKNENRSQNKLAAARKMTRNHYAGTAVIDMYVVVHAEEEIA